jgi:hypothetical protein
MSTVNVPIPPTIQGDSFLKTMEVQKMKITNDLTVQGDVTCDSLTSTTFVHAGTGMTSTLGNIVATAGNLVSNVGNVNAAAGCNIGFSVSGAVLGLGSNGTASVVHVGDSAALIGFYGVSPVVRPTTSITGAVFAANTSGITDGSATFGGYTMGQVVAALKVQGLLT